MPKKKKLDIIDKAELTSLIKESVKANVSVSNSLEVFQELLKNQKDNLSQLNDQFVLHCTMANDISKDVKLVRNQLLKWVKWCIIVIFTLLGGIIFAKALGLDLIDLIKQ